VTWPSEDEVKNHKVTMVEILKLFLTVFFQFFLLTFPVLFLLENAKVFCIWLLDTLK
jgi:hypothetical protein